MPQNRYRPYRRRRRFRRSPLSDLLMGLLIVVILLAVLLRSCRGGGTEPPQESSAGSPPPIETASETPEPTSTSTPEVVKETEIPWNLTLVNADHPLEEGFTVTTSTLSNGLEVDSRMYDALMDMLTACQAEGLEPLVCSAYRSVEKQTQLFQNKIDSYLADGLSYDEAYAATAVEIAVPGTSEHSLGLAVDICALSYQLLDESQEDTAEQQWLMAHCQEYGFILRYPEDKSDLTGIIYEPWHYRYVGVETATEIMAQGICLEEYLEANYALD